MEYMINISTYNCAEERCVGDVYHAFLDYAFSQANFFMLVFAIYYGKGLPARAKQIQKDLIPFRVKSRTNPSWPGVLETYCPNTTYKINFYHCCDESKIFLHEFDKLSDWSRPRNAEDLAFFKNNQCWFYSVGHEKIAAFLHATSRDMQFIKEHALLDSPRLCPYDRYYDAYNEELL